VTARRIPTMEFDHHSTQVAKDPAGVYAKLRDECPAFWTESHGGYWVFTRYRDVGDALSDDARYSSARRLDSGGDGSALSIPKRPSILQIPMEMDPPETKPYRDMLNPLLAPKAIERLRPAIAERVAWFIDRFIENGSCDLVRDLASPVPASTTIDWLGLAHDDWQMMATTMHNIVARVPGDPEWVKAGQQLAVIYDAVRQVTSERRKQPADDVISYLTTQHIGGRLITDDEILSIVALLIVGGVGTTTSLTSQSLVWLSQHRDDHKRLLADSKYLQLATEEFLRYFTPVQGLARTANGDSALHGCQIKDGDRILLGFGSANRDPDAFNSPDDVLLDRLPNRHMAFGVGIHRCIGSNLARVMFQETIKGVLSRIPDYAVDMKALRPYPSQGLNTGWQSIPATFTPSPSLDADLGSESLGTGR
jgi:cytochrome P450